MRAALGNWRQAVGAQTNQPNPAADPGKFRLLYQDFDPSRFDPARADPARWEQIWTWRNGMNAAVAGTGKKAKGKGKAAAP
jgi:hypothetical protein